MQAVQCRYSIECNRCIGFASSITVWSAIKTQVRSSVELLFFWLNRFFSPTWLLDLYWKLGAHTTEKNLSLFGPPKTGTRLSHTDSLWQWAHKQLSPGKQTEDQNQLSTKAEVVGLDNNSQYSVCMWRVPVSGGPKNDNFFQSFARLAFSTDLTVVQD